MGARVCLLLFLMFDLVYPLSYANAQSGSSGDVMVENVAFRDGEIQRDERT